MMLGDCNAMTVAFIEAKVKNITPLVSRVMDLLEKRLKKSPVMIYWKANLSYKTYRKLVSQGVPTQG